MATVWPLNHRKSTNQEPQKGTIEWSRTPIRSLDLSHKHFNRRHRWLPIIWWDEIHKGRRRRHPGSPLVSQTIPFTVRGRVWSHYNYWVVAEERNCRPLQLGTCNKMLTSAKHVVTWLLLHDNRCDLQRAWISLVTSSFCRGDNSMVAAWPAPFLSLCEGCGLRDYDSSFPPPPKCLIL